MTRPRLTLTLTALHLLLTGSAWAALEVSMEDRKEVFMGNATDIHCMFSLDDPATDPEIEWFMSAPGGRQRIHYKNGSEETQVEATNFKDRIRVSYSRKNTVLTINSVQISDEREYFCKVIGDKNSDEKHTQLTVFNPPSRPVIEAGQYVSADSDKLEKIATCTVENAHPTPKILWHKNDLPLQTDGDVIKVMDRVTVNPNNLQTIQSELQLKMVKKEDKDAEFYCEVSYFTVGGERMVESPRVKIPVHYQSTEVNMYQVSPRGLVKEGDRVEIRCEGDGTLTPDITFSDDEFQDLKSENGSLVLEKVSRADNGQYLCTYLEDWTNELKSSFNLSVHFMDDVVITPEQPVEVDEGQHLTLTCNALSSLPTRPVWYKDGTRLDEGHVLTVNPVSRETSGKYSCKVEATELPDLWRENSLDVIVRVKPEIVDGVDVVQQGENVFNLTCGATGHPTPSITWTLSDEQIPLGEWIEEEDYGVISIITISATSTINATCTATSEMGADTVSRSVDPRELENQFTTDITSSSTTGPPTTYYHTEPPAVTREPPKKNERVRKESSGFIIAILIILVLLLAILGSVLYFLYKKGKIPCGRSGKQDLTKESASKDDFVVEMKSGKSEEAVLLQGVNGDKKIPNDQ